MHPEGSARLRARHRARVLVVASLAAVLLGMPVDGASARAPTTGSADPAAAAPGQPLGPEDHVAVDAAGARMSPELAGVEVDSTDLDGEARALDRARDATRRAEARRLQGQDRLRALDLDRLRAVDGVTAAEAARADAEAGRALAEEELARRQASTEAAERRLVDARLALRDVVVAAYMRPDDELVGLASDPTAVMTAGRERVLADAVGGDRKRWVDRRVDELAAADRAMASATDELAAARSAVADRTADVAARRADVDIVDDRIAAARTDAREAEAAVMHTTAELATAQAAVSDARVLATVEGADFPLVALDAYWRAAARAPCRIEWWALAGITRVESGHGTYGGSSLDVRGVASPGIVGIALDGEGETAVITDTDGGLLDGDVVFDRAVGPMQFIPSTWAGWAADGNLDGVASPHDLYDAALAAAGYLCVTDPDLTDDDGLRRAYLSYNQSPAYVEEVLAGARAYQRSVSIAGP